MNEGTRGVRQQPAGTSENDEAAEPLLTLHAAVVLLSAVLIVLVVGGLTFLSTESIPTAGLAGLSAGGASLKTLRSLIA